MAPIAHIRAVLAWAWAPMVYMLPLWGIRYILFKDEMFKITHPVLDSVPLLSGLFMLISMVDVVVFVLYLYILLSGLAQVNRFSFFRGLGVFMLYQLIVYVFVLLLSTVLMPAGFTF